MSDYKNKKQKNKENIFMSFLKGLSFGMFIFVICLSFAIWRTSREEDKCVKECLAAGESEDVCVFSVCDFPTLIWW